MDIKTYQEIDKLILELREKECQSGFEIGMGRAKSFKCKRLASRTLDIHMKITKLISPEVDFMSALARFGRKE